MRLCYQLDTGSDACGLARGSAPLHRGLPWCTDRLDAVTCTVCLAAVALMLI